ncbi:MAG: Acyl-CoA dehydrogenase, partial [uncultured Pseudonocardia sp.]
GPRPAARRLLPLRRRADRRRARRAGPRAGVPGEGGGAGRAGPLDARGVPAPPRPGVRRAGHRGPALRGPARPGGAAAAHRVRVDGDRPHRPVDEQLLRHPQRAGHGQHRPVRLGGAARALAPGHGPDGADRGVRAHRAARRVRRRARAGDHRPPRGGRVGARRGEALDRQRHVRRPGRHLGARRRRRQRQGLRRGAGQPRHDDLEDREQGRAAHRAERRHRAAGLPGARGRPPGRGELLRRHQQGAAPHPRRGGLGLHRHDDGRLRDRTGLRAGARAVRPPDRGVPARAGPARTDARQHHRLARHGRQARAPAGHRAGPRRPRGPGQGVLHHEDARDRRPRPRGGGRQRGDPRLRRGEVLRRRRGAVLLRGHPADQHPGRGAVDHGAQRVRL